MKSYLKVPVNQPVQLEVIVVLSKGVDQGLGNLSFTFYCCLLNIPHTHTHTHIYG